MSFYYGDFIKGMDTVITWIFVSKEEKRMIWYVRRYCRQCEILGICRDEKITGDAVMVVIL